MFSAFRKEKNYLNQYYLRVIAVLLPVNLLLFFMKTPELSILYYAPVFALLVVPDIRFAALATACAVTISVLQPDFNWLYLAGIPVAVALTFTATALLHNASHSNVHPAWLNRPVGELMGLFQLVGFPDWTIIHVLHHQRPDDPTMDPHPPLGRSYQKFLMEMRQSITIVLVSYYFKLWNKDTESGNNLKKLALQTRAATLLKVIFWYLLLGPQIFTFFFAFSVAFKMLHYAWFNHATHVHTEQGTLIVNRDQGVYRLINAIAFGLYYHKNHHIRAGLFDPRTLNPDHAIVQKQAA